jgi:hypothetical protein
MYDGINNLITVISNNKLNKINETKKTKIENSEELRECYLFSFTL